MEKDERLQNRHHKILKSQNTYNRDDLFPGCDQYHLLELQLDVHETPTKLFWRPGKFTRNLSLNISTGCVAKYEIAQSSSQSWFDITFQRASGGKPTLLSNVYFQRCPSLNFHCHCKWTFAQQNMSDFFKMNCFPSPFFHLIYI